jgi:hypothetical protein
MLACSPARSGLPLIVAQALSNGMHANCSAWQRQTRHNHHIHATGCQICALRNNMA